MRKEFEKFMKAMDMDEFNLIRDSEYGDKLTYINILHLYIISHTDKITVSELADKLNMSRPAITQKINELEKLGMIVKNQSEKDKRIYYISISNTVKDTLKQCKMATVVDAVEKNFSEQKKETFKEILSFMSDYVNIGKNNE